MDMASGKFREHFLALFVIIKPGILAGKMSFHSLISPFIQAAMAGDLETGIRMKLLVNVDE